MAEGYMFTPMTEVLRKDLAKLWKVPPFKVDVTVSPSGELQITVDGVAPSEELMQQWQNRIRECAAERRRRMN